MTAHATTQTRAHKPVMGILEIHLSVFRRGNMLWYKLAHAVWIFIIHTFVLHTDKILWWRDGRGEGCGGAREINNSDKSCLVRGEEKG